MRCVRSDRSNAQLEPPRGAEDWCEPVWVEHTVVQLSDEQSVSAFRLVFELDPPDLEQLHAGGRVELTIVGAGIPPVSLRTVAGPAVDPWLKARMGRPRKERVFD